MMCMCYFFVYDNHDPNFGQGMPKQLPAVNGCPKGSRKTSVAVTAKLISAFVFATGIERFLDFLDPKFPASNHLL